MPLAALLLTAIAWTELFALAEGEASAAAISPSGTLVAVALVEVRPHRRASAILSCDVDEGTCRSLRAADFTGTSSFSGLCTELRWIGETRLAARVGGDAADFELVLDVRDGGIVQRTEIPECGHDMPLEWEREIRGLLAAGAGHPEEHLIDAAWRQGCARGACWRPEDDASGAWLVRHGMRGTTRTRVGGPGEQVTRLAGLGESAAFAVAGARDSLGWCGPEIVRAPLAEGRIVKALEVHDGRALFVTCSDAGWSLGEITASGPHVIGGGSEGEPSRTIEWVRTAGGETIVATRAWLLGGQPGAVALTRLEDGSRVEPQVGPRSASLDARHRRLAVLDADRRLRVFGRR
jgi:hypothetical protein